MITLILGVFHHFCKSARSASRQRENFMESLHSDGSATYLLIIWVEKKYTFNNEIETKTISLNCFSKYTSIFIDYTVERCKITVVVILAPCYCQTSKQISCCADTEAI